MEFGVYIKQAKAILYAFLWELLHWAQSIVFPYLFSDISHNILSCVKTI